MEKHTLAVVTGTRAEYGLLRPVLQKLHQSETIQPVIIATGAHLMAAFGNTVQEIEHDGFYIAAQIDIMKFGNSRLGVAQTVPYAIQQFTQYFTQNRPDAVLVLGDRYEIFAVGTAAALFEIPLVHISGSDVTYGAADEYFRHCLTKMASLHFPSCAQYAQRVIAMGEHPSTVENVGGLGDENLRNLPVLSRAELTAQLGFDFEKPFALATFHPETAGGTSPMEQFEEMLAALAETNLRVVFTKANADAGGVEINARLDALCAQEPEKYVAFTSMGVVRYLSAMRYCTLVIGNSSSGVVETPTLGVPCINLGARQTGRIMCDNVICCDVSARKISAALIVACSQAFQEKAKKTISPYNGGDTSGKIVRRLEQFFTSESFGKPKLFYDING